MIELIRVCSYEDHGGMEVLAPSHLAADGFTAVIDSEAGDGAGDAGPSALLRQRLVRHV